jgi:thiol-disulfide isomerase/thioredoxin
MKFVSINPESQDALKFDKLINERETFVKFYHPSCGHCQNMASAWSALKKHPKLKDLDLNIVEVHVGATPYIKSSVARKAENQGVPFILMVNKGGEVTKMFDSERSVEEMVKFILNNVNERKRNKKTKKVKTIKKTKKVKKHKKHARKTKKSLTI